MNSGDVSWQGERITMEMMRKLANISTMAGMETIQWCRMRNRLRWASWSVVAGGLDWNFIELQLSECASQHNIMHRTLQYLWTRVQETQHKYPPPPPSFSQLCPTPESSSADADTYSTVLTHIQQQLQKRIINVQKIKSIGQQLYDKLSQDIAVLHDNHRILAHMDKIQQAVSQCESRFLGLVDQLVGRYRSLLGDNQVVDGFEIFVRKDYQHYCTAVDKEVIPLYQQIIQQINMIKVPTNQQLADSHLQAYSYLQNFPTLMQVLTKFRSMLTSEYQILLNTRANKQEQCRAAVLFLSKLRTLFVEMKDVLWDNQCSLNSINQYGWQQKYRIMQRLKASYRKYIRADNLGRRKSDLFMIKSAEIVSNQESRQQESETRSIKSNIKIKKINYTPAQQWTDIGLYSACHSQVLQYLYLTYVSPKQLATLDHNIAKAKQPLLTSMLIKFNANSIQNTFTQIRNKIKFYSELVNIGCWMYFQQAESLASQYVNRLDRLRISWHSVEIFVTRFGKICSGLIGRLKQIGAMDKKVQMNQCANICIELHQISQKLTQIIGHMENDDAINNTELKNTLISQIATCQQLRSLFHKSQKINKKVEQIGSKKVVESQSIAQHILIEQQPNEQMQEDLNVEDEVNKMMEYVDRSTEFYEFQFKNLMANGYELIVYHLEKSANSKKNDTKLQKLQASIKNLLKMSRTHTRLLSYKQKQQNSLNLDQIRRQCQSTTFNSKVLDILVSISYTAASGKSIIAIYEECINFEYQDWQSKIKQFESQLKIFHAKCKQVYQLQISNTTSLFSIVYRTLKEYISILQIIYDIFEETLYIFSHCKQLEVSRKGNIHNKSINIISQHDLSYLTEILGYRIKMNEEISQIDKFNNISKIARNYLKAIYIKFRNNYNGYIPFEDTLLNNLIKRMQSAIGFTKSHAQIFRIYQAAAKRAVNQGNKRQLDELWGMSKQILELQKEYREIEKLSHIQISIDMRSIEQVKKIFKLHGDEVKFAQIVSDLHDSQAKSRIDSDAKNRSLHNSIIEAFKNYYR